MTRDLGSYFNGLRTMKDLGIRALLTNKYYPIVRGDIILISK